MPFILEPQPHPLDFRKRSVWPESERAIFQELDGGSVFLRR